MQVSVILLFKLALLKMSEVLLMACLCILFSTAIPVNKISVPSDMIRYFYIAELITQMTEI